MTFDIANGNVTSTAAISPRGGGIGNWGVGVGLSYTPFTSAPSNLSWGSAGLFVGLSRIDSVRQLAGWTMSTSGNLALGPYGIVGSVGNINLASNDPFTYTLGGTLGTPTLARAGIANGASNTIILYDGTIAELGDFIMDVIEYATDVILDAAVDINFNYAVLVSPSPGGSGGGGNTPGYYNGIPLVGGYTSGYYGGAPGTVTGAAIGAWQMTMFGIPGGGGQPGEGSHPVSFDLN